MAQKENIITRAYNSFVTLPSEFKVTVYLLVSAIISQLLISLTGIQTDDALLLGIVNVALVFLREQKKRIDEH